MARRHFLVQRRRDANHKAIQDALEAVGVRLFDTSGVGGGCGDVIALKPNKRDIVMLEIKTDKGKKKKTQERSHQEWPIVTVRTIDEALAAVGALESRSEPPR